MHKTAALLATWAFALAGCAVAPVPQLPPVDVSALGNDRALSGLEITALVQGRQVTGNITRADGARLSTVSYAFFADGTLMGMWPEGGDEGKWYVDHGGGEICTMWLRSASDCRRASVRNGKLLLLNPRLGHQFLQQ